MGWYELVWFGEGWEGWYGLLRVGICWYGIMLSIDVMKEQERVCV